jgi:hypothetical protein
VVKNATSTETSDLDIRTILEDIRTGKYKAPVEEYRAALLGLGKKAAGEFKKDLPAFTPSGTFSKRNNSSLKQHSGLLCADLDNLNGDLPVVRQKLLSCPHISRIYVSAGGNGLKAIFRVPADPAQHAGSFSAVKACVKKLTGHDVDEACKDLSRLSFVSYDPELVVNDGPIEIAPLPEPEKPKAQQSNGQASLSERQRIVEAAVGPVDWIDELHGFCDCPGKDRHTNANGAKDCKVFLDGATGLHCVHLNCKGIVEAINHAIRSRIGKAEYRPPNAREERMCEWRKLSTVKMLPIRFVDKPLFQAAAFHLLVGKKGVGKGTLLGASGCVYNARRTRRQAQCALDISGRRFL